MRAWLRLRVGRASVRAELVRRRRVLWAGEAAFATPQELEEAVSQLAAGGALPVRPAAVRVELESPLVQLRTLRRLPPVRATQLRPLVATQAGRFFRRNGKPLVTDACWTGREARREGRALAAAAEEPWLDAVIDGARTAGLDVESVRPAGLPAGARLDLTPPAERRRRKERALLSVRRIGVAACVAWLAVAGVFVVRLRQERVAVDREMAQLDGSVSAVREARRALSEAARIVETIDCAESERGRILARLSAVAIALPDSAFLTSLVVDSTGRGELSLVARRSMEVLAALDRADAAPSSSVTGAVLRETIAGRDWERFTVRFGSDRPR